MNTLQTIWNGLDWSVLTDILISVIPALVCITLHELAHGFVAYKLGDMTAKSAGRLSLNPIKHIDIFGLIMMVVFRFGWAKPVPVNMNNFNNPKRDMAITAVAGPLCNLLLACVLLFIYGMLYAPLMKIGNSAAVIALRTVATTAFLSLSLAIFNIIPISPLDGSKVLFSFLSEKNYYTLMKYERFGMIILFAVVATGILGNPLTSAAQFVYDKVFIFAEWGFNIVINFM